MKLLVITNLFHPDRGGGASVFSDLCFGLADKGWDVTVLTTYPYYPEWRRKEGCSPWRIERETLHRVDVWRHGIYVPANPSRLLPRSLQSWSSDWLACEHTTSHCACAPTGSTVRLPTASTSCHPSSGVFQNSLCRCSMPVTLVKSSG